MTHDGQQENRISASREMLGLKAGLSQSSIIEEKENYEGRVEGGYQQDCTDFFSGR